MMKAKPMGMLWMMPAGWLDDLPGVASQVTEPLSEGRLIARMNKFTLLDGAIRAFGGAAGGRPVGEVGRRQRLTGIPDPGGESRHLFGVGEGPAVAVAKQGRTLRRSFTSRWHRVLLKGEQVLRECCSWDCVAMPESCVNFVSVATGKSLLAPLVTHLSTTCNPRF
jgi:hypothetical protein